MAEYQHVMFASRGGRVRMFGSYNEASAHANQLRVKKSEMKKDIERIEKILSAQENSELDELTLKDLAKKYLQYICLCD